MNHLPLFFLLTKKIKLIHLLIPNNNVAERIFAVNVILSDFLGLNFKLQLGETKFAAEITLENGNKLCIEDHFFCAFNTPLSYLCKEHIPQQIQYITCNRNPFIYENDLPILFGNGNLDISNSEITCGIDIFALTFFMLTRWEEYVISERDSHGRFPAKSSLAGKFNILHRPIVNEIVEMFWAMLVHLGIRQIRNNRQFEMLITHDVDDALLWHSLYFFIKKLGGDFIKRFDLKAVIYDLKSYYKTRFNGQLDPYNSFNFLMQCADKHRLQAYFFFLCGGNSNFDHHVSINTPFMHELFKNIAAKGHVIGFHPSYDTLNNSKLFTQEKKALEQITGLPICYGRQHFLRFEAPTTWQTWEDHGMSWDSSLYYPEHPGFRCGVCYPFPVFNFLTRQKLKLKEIPLTAMEVSWTTYLHASPSKMLNDLLQLKQTVHKYNGTFVLLWHNSNFNTPEWKNYMFVYEQFLESASK